MPEIVFKGKEYVYNHHLTVPYRPLVPQADKSVGGVDLGGDRSNRQLEEHGLQFAQLPCALSCES